MGQTPRWEAVATPAGRGARWEAAESRLDSKSKPPPRPCADRRGSLPAHFEETEVSQRGKALAQDHTVRGGGVEMEARLIESKVQAQEGFSRETSSLRMILPIPPHALKG